MLYLSPFFALLRPVDSNSRKSKIPTVQKTYVPNVVSILDTRLKKTTSSVSGASTVGRTDFRLAATTLCAESKNTSILCKSAGCQPSSFVGSGMEANSLNAVNDFLLTA